MISQESALDLVVTSAYNLGKEKIPLIKSLGRILAEDVYSDIDMPSYNKSAMDGYACRLMDIENTLNVLETIPAGKTPEKIISENQCSKVMTGSMIPEGADCVIMIEDTEIVDLKNIRYLKSSTNTNIRYQGEELKKGEIALNKATLIKPEHIAVLASVGKLNPSVYLPPKIGVISTGDEIIEPDFKPLSGQTRNTNALQIIAQIYTTPALSKYYGIAKDNHKILSDIITESINENDITIITGGVSEGDFDFVPEILNKLNFDIVFKNISVQPGKPTLFAKYNNKFCFGLPGNPVSSFIQFNLLVKPLIYSLMGMNYSPLVLKLPLLHEYIRRKSSRKSYVPVKITQEGNVIPVNYKGSAHILSFLQADGIMSLDIGFSTYRKGELVDIRLL